MKDEIHLQMQRDLASVCQTTVDLKEQMERMKEALELDDLDIRKG